MTVEHDVHLPQADKVMRMHAQTAMIGNGVVHVPNTAPWLAHYLHELTSFPNGRHDDQVDLTAQMLDWFKRGAGPRSNAGNRASGFGGLQHRLADSGDAGSQVVLQFLLLLLGALFVFGLLLPLVRRPRLLLAHLPQ
jgi:hypothetical protein